MTSPCYILGGTTVLERSIQTALGSAPIACASVEEVQTKAAGAPDAIVVLGPTFRRSIAAINQLRSNGQATLRIVLVYRDDQKDEVKRHQAGKATANQYVQQSRAQKDLEPALRELLAASGARGETAPPDFQDAQADIEEIDAVELIDEDDAGTIDSDALEAIEDVALEDEPTAPLKQQGATALGAEVLGELDMEGLVEEELETVDSIETLEPEAIELAEDEDVLEPLEEVLDAGALEEDDAAETLDAADVLEVAAEPAAEDAGIQTLDASDLREETAAAHDEALAAEMQGLRQKLAIAQNLTAESEAQNASLQAKLSAQLAEIASLHEQLKSARAQVATMQTKMIDCRIQAEEAAAIVKALAGKLG